MIIILEGPEAAGKSTLATMLSKQTGFPVVHRSKPNTEEEKKNMMQMYINAIDVGANVIFDRCWYSEMVYGTIMRDTSYISEQQMYALENKLAKTGAIVIHCTDTIDKLWCRCCTRGEDYVTEKQVLDQIRQGFEHVFHELPHLIPIVRYTIANCLP